MCVYAVFLCDGVCVCAWQSKHPCIWHSGWLTKLYSYQLLYFGRSYRNWGHNLYWKLYLLFLKCPESNWPPSPILSSQVDILLYQLDILWNVHIISLLQKEISIYIFGVNQTHLVSWIIYTVYCCLKVISKSWK